MTDQQPNQPTTTHAERGAGNPLLRVTRDGEGFEHPLVSEIVRIGSAAGNELQLADTDPVHATIDHDDRDEYVLTLHGEGEMNANPESLPGDPNEKSEILRTGARFTTGPWTLVFARDEFADHGRPYGGREGGEFSDQPPQPQRPSDLEDTEQDKGATREVKDG